MNRPFSCFVIVIVCTLALSCGAGDESESVAHISEHTQGEGAIGDTSYALGPGGDEGLTLPPGRWARMRSDTRHRLTEDQLRAIKQLESIAYLTGSRPGPDIAGVVKHDSERAFRGYNFYVSGHAPEAVLMDMDGKVLHTWAYDFDNIWPGRDIPEGGGRYYWRRAYLCENGDIMAIHEGIGLIKLDKHSTLIWEYAGRAHHDLDVLEDGTIYVLTREARVIPRINEDEPVLEDFIVALSPGGNELRKASILECLERYEHLNQLPKMLDKGDILHTNTIEVLDGRLEDRSSAFRAGNVLISILKMDTIAIVDLEAEKVVWALSGARGNWRRQHQPTLLPGGTMLLFDNKGYRGRSKVMEFDPIENESIWAYTWTQDNPFYSESCGSCQRLENGNTLITESDGGRAFEVTPDKTVVWEFVNPHVAEGNEEYIATLFEVIRLRPDFPLDWIP